MKALQTEAYNKGYSDGLDMAPPSHHDLKGTELDDYPSVESSAATLSMFVLRSSRFVKAPM